MRSRSRGRRRSADKGTCGPGIQPRKPITPGRRRCSRKRKAPSEAQYREPRSPTPHYSLKFEITFCVRGVASPLLANVYLHYVFDLWVQAWRQKRARGEVIVVRFADDIVVGFNSPAEADQFRAELTERMRKFHLE